MLLYVDDKLISNNHLHDVNELKSLLCKESDMKDLGPAKKILGMKIDKDMKSIRLWFSQQGYVDNALNKFNTRNMKPMSTPLTNHFKFSIDQCPKIDAKVEYMQRFPMPMQLDA